MSLKDILEQEGYGSVSPQPTPSPSFQPSPTPSPSPQPKSTPVFAGPPLDAPVLNPDDQVRVDMWAVAATTPNLNLYARIYNPDSGKDQVIQIGKTQTLATLDASSVTTFYSGANALGGGMLKSLSLQNVATSFVRGQIYVRLWLSKGQSPISGPSNDILLAQGYVYNFRAVVFNAGGPTTWENSTDGPGRIYNIAPSNPAAGAEFSIAAPANRRWRFISLSCKLVASAAAASRYPSVTINDGTAGNEYVTTVGVQSAVTAGATTYYMFVANPTVPYVSNITSNNTVANLSNVGWHYGTGAAIIAVSTPGLLPAGHKLLTSTPNIQAGDQYTIYAFVVEEWIDV